SGFAGAGFRPASPRPAARADAEAIRFGRRLEQSWRAPDRDRPEERRAISETQRQGHRALSLECSLLAEHIDASRKICAGLLARNIAEPGCQAVESADKFVHVGRGLNLLLCADRGQKLLEARHRDAELTFEAAVTIDRQCSRTDGKDVALLDPDLRDVDAAVGCLNFAETRCPWLR